MLCISLMQNWRHFLRLRHIKLRKSPEIGDFLVGKAGLPSSRLLKYCFIPVLLK